MIRAVGIVLACCMAAPALAGEAAQRPPVALTASPARVTLAGSGHATVRVANTGTRPVGVDVGRAGFSLDLRGRPRVFALRGARTARPWLSVHRRRLLLPAGGSATLTVAAAVPPRAEPGDHDALVLLTTRSAPTARVAVRMRIGLVVVVRVPGAIVRKLELRRLRVQRMRRAALRLELLVVNRGNVTERLTRGRITITLRQGGRARAQLAHAVRDLRPRTAGIVQFSYRGPLVGWATAQVTVRSSSVVGARRAFRVRL